MQKAGCPWLRRQAVLPTLGCVLVLCTLGLGAAFSQTGASPSAATQPASLELLLAKEQEGFPGGIPASLKGTFYTELAEAWTDRIDALVNAADQAAEQRRAKKTPPAGPGDLTPAKAAERAVAAGKKAVTLAPQSPRAHTALAVALGKMTDYVDNSTKMALSREIRDEAEKALALDAGDEMAHHILGRWNYGLATINPVLKLAARAVYGKLPDASLEAAQSHLEQAVALNPRRLTTHYSLALIYKQTGDKEKARLHWKAVLSLPASDAEDRAAQQDAHKALGK